MSFEIWDDNKFLKFNFLKRFRTNLWNHYVKSYTTKDWCISRQLWWGQRIPAFKCSMGDESKWFAAQSQEDALQQAVSYFSTLSRQEVKPEDVCIQQGVAWVRFVWVDKHTNKNKFFFPQISQHTMQTVTYLTLGSPLRCCRWPRLAGRLIPIKYRSLQSTLQTCSKQDTILCSFGHLEWSACVICWAASFRLINCFFMDLSVTRRAAKWANRSEMWYFQKF